MLLNDAYIPENYICKVRRVLPKVLASGFRCSFVWEDHGRQVTCMGASR